MIDFNVEYALFKRNTDKNILLQETRNISFEEIELAIRSGLLMDIIQHPALSHQYIFIVLHGEIIYKIPFVIESPHTYFLKTIYPHSVSKKIYLSL